MTLRVRPTRRYGGISKTGGAVREMEIPDPPVPAVDAMRSHACPAWPCGGGINRTSFAEMTTPQHVARRQAGRL